MIDESVNEVIGLLKGVSDLVWHSNDSSNPIPIGNWYTYTISPLPLDDEIEKVYADIYYKDRDEFNIYENGMIAHDSDCMESNHELPCEIITEIKNLERETFEIAIWDNPYGIMDNQPVFIPLTPQINHFIFNKNRHINAGGYRDDKNGKIIPFFIPESVCYESDFKSLGNRKAERIANAFDKVSLWLIKFQLWKKLEANSNYKSKTWLGNEHKQCIEDVVGWEKYDQKVLYDFMFRIKHYEIMDKLKNHLSKE